MLKLFRHPIWQVITVAISLVAIIASYHIFVISRQVKKLDILTQYAGSISSVDIGSISPKEIKITYGDEPINSVQLMSFLIVNSGTEVIRAEDFAIPIRLTFPQGAVVTDMQQISSSPQNLILYGTAIDNSLVLTPLLLNPNDNVTIQVTILNSNEYIGSWNIFVDGRIAGVKELGIDINREPYPYYFTFSSIWYGFIGSPNVLISSLIIICLLGIWQIYVIRQELTNQDVRLGIIVRIYLIAVLMGAVIGIMVAKTIDSLLALG